MTAYFTVKGGIFKNSEGKKRKNILNSMYDLKHLK